MKSIGFKEAQRRLIKALETGAYLHETDRASIETKNLLLMGEVTPDTICEVIKRSRGQDHSSSAHHQAPEVEVHVIKCQGWYVKFYFLDPDTWFISVHK